MVAGTVGILPDVDARILPHRRSLFPSLVLTGLLLATGACSPPGGAGQVPTSPQASTPSTDPGPPDETAAPALSPSPSTGSSTPLSSSPSASVPIETMIVRAYYILGGEVGVDGLVPTLRVVPRTSGVARAAMDALLDGGTIRDANQEISTAIPPGTTLLGVSIKDGIATVDLSGEFEVGGGSTSGFRRLGQVVYTLTQFSNVRAVLFQVEGRTVTTFGSGGIVLDGPQARSDFEDLLPSMFVDRPALDAAIGNPARVTGTANVFEATFRIAILDGAGNSLVDEHAMASCGTGCRGAFDVTLQYDVAKAQWDTLRVYFESAKDGQPEDIHDYPVWLTPAG